MGYQLGNKMRSATEDPRIKKCNILAELCSKSVFDLVVSTRPQFFRPITARQSLCGSEFASGSVSTPPV